MSARPGSLTKAFVWGRPESSAGSGGSNQIRQTKIRWLVNIFSSLNQMLGSVVVHDVSQPTANQRVSIPFIENFGGVHMHSQSHTCHCPLPCSCQWWPWGLPFACTTYLVKTVMLVAKLDGALWPLPGNKGREYGGPRTPRHTWKLTQVPVSINDLH